MVLLDSVTDLLLLVHHLMLLYSEILLLVVHYSLLVVLLSLLLQQKLVILQHYLIFTPHLQVLVTHTGSAGTSLDLVIFLPLLVDPNVELMITTRHQIISGLVLIGVQ